MDLNFLIKASGIVFRESLEAVMIYGIIISFFKKSSGKKEITAAKWGLLLGIIASVSLGAAFSGIAPLISAESFSYIEIVIILGGGLLMLYMVFWMSEHAKTMKKDLETDLSHALSLHSLGSIVGTVFVAVLREGFETVVYLYGLTLENSSIAHRASVLLSLAIGVSLSFAVYQLMIHGSKFLSMKVIFKITGIWLLCSASSLLATGIDKLYSAGFFEKISQPLFAIELPASLAPVNNALESMIGLRLQPSAIHFATFLLFWGLILYKDPLGFRQKKLTI